MSASERIQPYQWPNLDEANEAPTPEFVPRSLHRVVSPENTLQRRSDEPAAAANQQAAAEGLAEAARQQAEQVRAQVQRQAAAQARQELVLALRTATEEQVAAFEQARDQLLQELRSAYDQALAEIEQEMLSLITAMAEKVIMCKLETDDKIVVGIVRETLSRAAGANQVTVRISPADEPLVREAQQQLMAVLGQVDDLRIVADEQLLRGGCLVETERGRLDARIDTQLQLLSDEVGRLLKAG